MVTLTGWGVVPMYHHPKGSVPCFLMVATTSRVVKPTYPIFFVEPKTWWFGTMFLFFQEVFAGPICAMVKSRYIGDGHPTFNRNPYNGYINPYYWVDDHPLLYGNNGSLDPGTYYHRENVGNPPWYVRCTWGWLLRGPPSQGYHHFPYDISFWGCISKKIPTMKLNHSILRLTWPPYREVSLYI